MGNPHTNTYINTHRHTHKHTYTHTHTHTYYAAVEKVSFSMPVGYISRSLHSRKVDLELYIPCTLEARRLGV